MNDLTLRNDETNVFAHSFHHFATTLIFCVLQTWYGMDFSYDIFCFC